MPAADLRAATLLPLHAARTSGGDLAHLDAGDLSLLQYPSTELESGPAGIWLRVNGTAHRLTGPASGGHVGADGVITTAHPAAPGLTARVRFDLTEDASRAAWGVEIRNESAEPVRADLLHALDVALAEHDHLRRNEQYVAQYLDLTPVETRGSLALVVRQNLPGDTQPWAVIGASAPIDSWASDALQLVDTVTGEGLDAGQELPSLRLQHEHTLAALRTREQTIAPGDSWQVRLWVFAIADHPAATTSDDALLIEQALAGACFDQPVPPALAVGGPPEASGGAAGPGGVDVEGGWAVSPTVFSPARALPVRDANEHELEDFAPGVRRHVESDDQGLLSFFTGQAHVVTARKERTVLRPHGHLQHVSATASPDQSAVASTAWMSGVFCSQLTHGHASAAPVTSIRRSYLGLARAAGVRLAVRPAVQGADGSAATAPGPEGFELLTVPSLWSAGPDQVRWRYLAEHSILDVAATLALDGSARIELEVTGAELDVLAIVFPETGELSVQVTADGEPLATVGDELLSASGQAAGTDAVTALAEASRSLRLVVGPQHAAEAASAVSEPPHSWRLPTLTAATADEGVGAVDEFVRWLVHDAAVHYQAPRGLEQYSGGAWGTRDVSQGPVGLLVATDEHAALRETLARILAAQQDDGSWPQWFNYLPDHIGPGHRDAHGDVVYWPLLALGEYLAVTGDATILEESFPFVGQEEITVPHPACEHVARAMSYIAAHRTRDPRLPAYGHGDWNDSLQPARPELARQMCSTWTTELEIHALTALADGLAGVGAGGHWTGLVEQARLTATAAGEGLRELLLVDGELAGYAVLGEDETTYLVHPRDTTTGLRHGALQMIHAIAGEVLTRQEAVQHHRIIAEYLQGPTGVYLFDGPVEYHGGPMRLFQRAEAATFWGREIGLMYTHAHIRWVEALAALGETEEMWQQLLAIVPIGLPERVAGAAPRQSNCYYSSSDAFFPDRYTASENAEALFDPGMRFEGGWRVYSSGPGLILRLLVETVLGIRRRAGRLEIDPVLPAAFDGLEAQVPHAGGMITVRYHRGESGCGVREVQVDGQIVTGSALPRAYRDGGVAIDASLVPAGAVVEVVVG